jgi:hypothetical protein
LDEHSDLEVALVELRALLRRVELNQLEADDWPKVNALLAKYIDEAEEAGLEEVVIELPDREPRR